MSEIDKKHAELGGEKGFLGKPETEERVAPDQVGKFRHFQGGSIYWTPQTGAHEVHGLIRNKWAQLGWERSFLGYPKTDESPSPVGNGKYNQFQGGTILWFPPSKEAFEVHGAIRSKWGQLGWEGFLGFPVTDELTTPDGIGRFNHFQNGSIYWKPSISAHEVHGLIRKYWAAHGWETNPELGYPISDELPTSQAGKNRYGDFENGVVFWKHGTSAAKALEKSTLGNASKSVHEVLAEISNIVVPMLTSNDKIYIRNAPFLVEVTDYSFDGTSVHNRRYKVHTDLGIDITDPMPDPTVNLDLWIEISYDRSAKIVQAFLTQWSVHVHVPFPTSVGLKVSTVVDQFRAQLDPMLWKPNDVAKVPDGVNILSVKAMPNGDLNVYMEPLV